MPAMSLAPGSIISNRNRLWRIDAQDGDVLTVSAIDGGAGEQQFYVPFEDIRPGRLELPSASIVGHPSSQDLLLRAYRLSLLHGTAPLLSLQRSRVIPKDFQLVPVLMALDMPRVRMLIADDVGLGKTIEAGLIITELMARQMASRLLVIVPANLREQWQETLDYFFHIPARIISSRHQREMERELTVGANPWEHFRCLITSVDYAKQPAIKNQILEQRWDIVVFDEAHQVAKPHQSRADEHVAMDRWELAQALVTSPRVRHLLLLTATPHNGYSDSFASLLRMLDVGAVSGPVHAPHIERARAEKHVCQRRRRDVEAWFKDDPSRSPFPARDQSEVIVPRSDYLSTAIKAVEAYGDSVLANAAQGTAHVQRLAYWTVMHLHKRALSSPEALRCSLRNRAERLQRLLKGTTEGDAVGVSPEAARAVVLDEDPGEQLTDEEVGQRIECVAVGSPETVRAEVAELEEVLRVAQDVTPGRDTKLQKLLDSTLRDCLGRDGKVIIFTHYIDTLRYLDEQIKRDKRYAQTHVYIIHGGQDGPNERQRKEIIQQFERDKSAILLATDAISEGINLQRAAAQLIHYELPWNPNRLEQRNGRIDRFGQPKPLVYIRTMVMDETLDATILKVLVQKAAQIRQDYGFSPPYFGDETNVIDLIRQHDRLAARQLGLFDGPPDDAGTLDDPFAEETLERIKDESFYGQTRVTLPEIEKRLQETAATVGSPEHIKSFVFSGLNRFGCGVTENGDGSWRITVSNALLRAASVPSIIEKATFDAELGLNNPEMTVLDIGHPLVRRLIEEVKEDTFRLSFDGDTLHYGRTSYLVTSGVRDVTAIFHLLARYVVNTQPTAIIEEMLPVAMPVYGGAPLSAQATRALLQALPSPARRSDAEVKETLADALAIDDRDSLFAAALENRRQQLVAERQSLRTRLIQQEGARPADWLNGLDDLSPGSFDVLTVTILYPGAR